MRTHDVLHFDFPCCEIRPLLGVADFHFLSPLSELTPFTQWQQEFE